MAKFSAIIIDKVGLHARPASVLAKEASKYSSDIKILADGKSGNLKSIMNVMAMGIKSGSEVTIETTGADADAALEGVQEAMINAALIQG